MASTESQAAMDAARNAVSDFMSKNGQHWTTVHERVAPAVYHETIERSEHEEVTTVIDREIQQDHYHHSLQPITDTVTLEEQHHSNVLPVEERVFEHDDHEEVQRRLAAEQAKFQDEVQRIEGARMQTVVPVTVGEHVTHEVWEVIQPIVNKQTIEPHIIHTTIQIHERHHSTARHHTTSVLSPITMEEFIRQGGVLTGREERYDSFEGHPRSVEGDIGVAGSSIDMPRSSHAHHEGEVPTFTEAAVPEASTANNAELPASQETTLPPIPGRRATDPITAMPTEARRASAPTAIGLPPDSQYHPDIASTGQIPSTFDDPATASGSIQQPPSDNNTSAPQGKQGTQASTSGQQQPPSGTTGHFGFFPFGHPRAAQHPHPPPRSATRAPERTGRGGNSARRGGRGH